MLKRLFDVVLSLVVLLIFSPIILIVVCWVLINMGRPVLFRQKRPGKGGKVFELIKFRTMKDASGLDGKQLSDADRLTSLGKFLRSSSIDELPSLWNVVKGDMSLVGPRPLLTEYLSIYTPEQNRRHEVRPGVTGWAQVNGRNAISWEEKFKLDVWYVDNISFGLDIRILLITVKKVFIQEGIRHDNHESMPFFTGDTTSNNYTDND